MPDNRNQSVLLVPDRVTSAGRGRTDCCGGEGFPSELHYSITLLVLTQMLSAPDSPESAAGGDGAEGGRRAGGADHVQKRRAEGRGEAVPGRKCALLIELRVVLYRLQVILKIVTVLPFHHDTVAAMLADVSFVVVSSSPVSAVR
jgi:hypothetical protein